MTILFVSKIDLLVSFTGWLRLIWCLKWQVIFSKRATNYRAHLGKRHVKIRHPVTLRHPVSNVGLKNALPFKTKEPCMCAHFAQWAFTLLCVSNVGLRGVHQTLGSKAPSILPLDATDLNSLKIQAEDSNSGPTFDTASAFHIILIILRVSNVDRRGVYQILASKEPCTPSLKAKEPWIWHNGRSALSQRELLTRRKAQHTISRGRKPRFFPKDFRCRFRFRP